MYLLLYHILNRNGGRTRIQHKNGDRKVWGGVEDVRGIGFARRRKHAAAKEACKINPIVSGMHQTNL